METGSNLFVSEYEACLGEVLRSNPRLIARVKKPSEYLQSIIVDEDPENVRFIPGTPALNIQWSIAKGPQREAVRYIKRLADKVQDYLMDKNPEMIKWIMNPRSRHQVTAVHYFGLDGFFMINGRTTKKAQLTLIENFGSENIRHCMVDFYEDVALFAVEMGADALKYISPRRRTKKVVEHSLIHHPASVRHLDMGSGEYQTWLTAKLQRLVIEGDPTCLAYIRPGIRVKGLDELALKHWGSALKYVVDATPEQELMAVQQEPLAIKYVKHHTREIHEVVIDKGDPDLVTYIPNLDEDLQERVLMKKPSTAELINNPGVLAKLMRT